MKPHIFKKLSVDWLCAAPYNLYKVYQALPISLSRLDLSAEAAKNL
jgi:hypothetical protein